MNLKNLPHMPDAAARRDRCVALDRARRGVDGAVLPAQSATGTQGFLEGLLKAAPFKMAKILTDNDQAFTDRCGATGQRAPTGQHPFDRVGAAHAIAHRLITPRHPQTNGRVARCNGRLAEVLATHRCHSGEHLHDTLIRNVSIDHHHIPQRARGHVSPVAARQEWHQKKPDLFLSLIHI